MIPPRKHGFSLTCSGTCTGVCCGLSSVAISKAVHNLPQGTAEAVVATTGLQEFYNYADWRISDNSERSKAKQKKNKSYAKKAA